jgi:hypothetical protein
VAASPRRRAETRKTHDSMYYIEREVHIYSAAPKNRRRQGRGLHIGAHGQTA